MQDVLADVASKPATSWIASGFTFGVGSATYQQLINPAIGLIASILGIILTCTLIYVNIAKHKLERRVLLKQLGEHDDKI